MPAFNVGIEGLIGLRSAGGSPTRRGRDPAVRRRRCRPCLACSTFWSGAENGAARPHPRRFLEAAVDTAFGAAAAPIDAAVRAGGRGIGEVMHAPVVAFFMRRSRAMRPDSASSDARAARSTIAARRSPHAWRRSAPLPLPPPERRRGPCRPALRRECESESAASARTHSTSRAGLAERAYDCGQASPRGGASDSSAATTPAPSFLRRAPRPSTPRSRLRSGPCAAATLPSVRGCAAGAKTVSNVNFVVLSSSINKLARLRPVCWKS